MRRAVQIFAHRTDAEFAERLAEALIASRFSIRTGADDAPAAAVVVVWSPAALGSRALVAAAAKPLELGRLAAVSLGGAGAPEGFESVEPVDLEDWSGEVADPRWARVVAAIERAASSAAEAPAAPAADPAPDSAPVNEDAGAFAPAPAQLRARRAAPLAGAIALAGALVVGAFLFIAPNPGERRAEAPPTAPEVAPASAPRDDDSPPMLGALELADEREASPAPDDSPADEERAAPSEISADRENADPSPRGADPSRADDPLGALIAGLDDAAPDAAQPAPLAASGPFRDCDVCPLMARIPAGEGLVGAPEDESMRQRAETPPRSVRVERAFALGVHEVSFAEWDACAADGGCRSYNPSDAGWGRANRPVINVSWRDARAYAEWLSKKTGARYRLPSEAEWEYAARAGTKTPFSFGEQATARLANFDAAHPYGGGPPERARGRTLPVGSFPANPFGLHDMHGNVWEWVEDCWAPSHDRPPSDLSPREGRCAQRVVKGGAWSAGGWRMRAAHRLGRSADARAAHTGFRIARELEQGG